MIKSSLPFLLLSSYPSLDELRWFGLCSASAARHTMEPKSSLMGQEKKKTVVKTRAKWKSQMEASLLGFRSLALSSSFSTLGKSTYLQFNLWPNSKLRVQGRKLIGFFLFQGNSKFVRRFSNVLRNITTTFSDCLEYLMDRFHPSLSAFRRRSFNRSHLRRRLHGSPALRRHIP